MREGRNKGRTKPKEARRRGHKGGKEGIDERKKLKNKKRMEGNLLTIVRNGEDW